MLPFLCVHTTSAVHYEQVSPQPGDIKACFGWLRSVDDSQQVYVGSVGLLVEVRALTLYIQILSSPVQSTEDSEVLSIAHSVVIPGRIIMAKELH